MQEGQVVKNALRRLILPEMAPALHASLVLDSEFRLAKALIQVNGSCDDFVVDLLGIFRTNESELVKLIHLSIDTEFSDEATRLAPEVFRSNTIVTRLISTYGFQSGADYLKQLLQEPLEQLIVQNESFEIDPATGNHSEANEKRLNQIISTLFQRIQTSIDECPRNLCLVFRHIHNVVSMYRPDQADVIVGSFLFLRFIIPALLIPKRYGIVPEDRVLTKNVQRGLMLIAKVLQNLANNVLFDAKQAYMIPFNVFLTQNKDRMTDIIQQVCNSKPANKLLRNHGTGNLAQSLQEMAQRIDKHFDKIATQLTTCDERVSSLKLRGISSPILNELYKHMSHQGFERLTAETNDKSWKYWKTASQASIYRRVSSRMVSVKATRVITGSPEAVYRYINRSRYCPFPFSTTTTIEKFDDTRCIVHVSMKRDMKSLHRPRDACVLLSNFKSSSRTYGFVAESILRSDVPHVRGFVRAELNLSGVLIEPCGDSSSRLTILVQMNRKRSMPRRKTLQAMVDYLTHVSTVKSIELSFNPAAAA